MADIATNAEGVAPAAEADPVDDAEVDTLIREAVNQVVGEAAYSHAKAKLWSGSILEGCLKRLSAASKPFKYVVTCSIGQKAGAGMHAAAACRWEEGTDGRLAVKWENSSTLVVVTAFWLAI